VGAKTDQRTEKLIQDEANVTSLADITSSMSPIVHQATGSRVLSTEETKSWFGGYLESCQNRFLLQLRTTYAIILSSIGPHVAYEYPLALRITSLRQRSSTEPILQVHLESIFVPFKHLCDFVPEGGVKGLIIRPSTYQRRVRLSSTIVDFPIC